MRPASSWFFSISLHFCCEPLSHMLSAYSNRERISEVDSFKRFPINGEFKLSQKIHSRPSFFLNKINRVMPITTLRKIHP